MHDMNQLLTLVGVSCTHALGQISRTPVNPDDPVCGKRYSNDQPQERTRDTRYQIIVGLVHIYLMLIDNEMTGPLNCLLDQILTVLI